MQLMTLGPKDLGIADSEYKMPAWSKIYEDKPKVGGLNNQLYFHFIKTSNSVSIVATEQLLGNSLQMC